MTVATKDPRPLRHNGRVGEERLGGIRSTPVKLVKGRLTGCSRPTGDNVDLSCEAWLLDHHNPGI